MTIQDKIAALPPKCPSFEIVNGEVRYRYPERLFRAEAERDLALEALREARREVSIWLTPDCEMLVKIDAVIAACGGEKP
jgi:hypothetical protein